jgi:hypothetical protein
MFKNYSYPVILALFMLLFMLSQVFPFSVPGGLEGRQFLWGLSFDQTMRGFVTVLGLIGAMWAIFSRHLGAGEKHWASATAGGIIGYWLGGAAH